MGIKHQISDKTHQIFGKKYQTLCETDNRQNIGIFVVQLTINPCEYVLAEESYNKTCRGVNLKDNLYVQVFSVGF